MQALKTLVIAVVASATFGASSFAQECTKIVNPKPADTAFDFISVRRPIPDVLKAMKQHARDILVEIVMDPGLARVDDDSLVMKRIEEVATCKDSVRFKAFVVTKDGYHVTEIPVPKEAKSLRIRSCSGMAKLCWEGTFNGDFDRWVTLKPATPGGGESFVLRRNPKE